MQNASVAQLDRVTGYEPVGRGFESLRAHHKNGVTMRFTPFLFCADRIYAQIEL